MKRRQLLWGAIATTGSVLLARCATVLSPTPGRSRVVSQAGELVADLTAAETWQPLAGRQARLLSYSGQVPGPLLEMNAGDRVQLRLHNRLTQPTNLHFHGLHIPPTDQADNVFRVAASGETLNYAFDLSPDHPGGLFWYHPHHHGTVAEQVFGGLAGPLIVRGAIDQVPEIQAADEAVLVLQDFDLDRRGNRREPMPMFRRWGREGDLITVNGDRPPQLPLPQNGLLRLRLLNASASRIYRLRLQNHPWHLIGLDGGALAAPTEIDELILAPGERADLLVAGQRDPAAYDLVSLPYDRGIANMMHGMGHHPRGGDRNTAPQSLAILTYTETTTPTPLPTALLPVVAPGEPIRRREFVLDHGINQGQFFLINGRGFDHHRIDTRVQLGTVEDWHILNKAGMDHPFHLHTNGFQVLRRDGQPVADPVWKDTVNIPAYGSIDLRVAFADFPGVTVYHCHILDHEDQGMMGQIEMQPSA
ncbi:MAG: multicopper oxidase family protein [Leptolyngbyaceae cyanobacterium T60_A2020_046]|nr:multicopper oxidase family protein [Leptolyngbyaceae cyanobacterium T60_A2020_046]